MKDHYTPQGHREPAPGPYIPGTQIPMNPMGRIEAWLKRIADTIGNAVASKLDKNIGPENVGKTLIADENGDLQPGEAGGGAQNVVKTIEQTLTEAEKMQARKNQGLYYSEITAAEPIVWDGNTEGRVNFTVSLGSRDLTYYKISDKVFTIPELVGGTLVTNAGEEGTELELTEELVFDQYGMVTVTGLVLSANAGSYVYGVYNIPENGTYSLAAEDTDNSIVLTPFGTETIIRIEEKYIPQVKGDFYVVNFTGSDLDNPQVDKTFSEIRNALGQGLVPVIVRYNEVSGTYDNFILTRLSSNKLIFSRCYVNSNSQALFDFIKIDNSNDVYHYNDGPHATVEYVNEIVGDIESVLETI